MCGVDGQPPFDQPDYEQNRAEHSEWMDRGCPADCAKQDYRYPGDAMTLADHVERFAEDQAAWVEEFLPTMEKMISNGYGQGDLVKNWPIPDYVSLATRGRVLGARNFVGEEVELIRG